MKPTNETPRENRYCPFTGFECKRTCRWYLQAVEQCAVVVLAAANIRGYKELMGRLEDNN